jgi:hypothetical protein
MIHNFLLLGNFFAGLSVLAGAFGAHALALLLTGWTAEKWPGKE